MRKYIRDQILALTETVEKANRYVIDVVSQDQTADILSFLADEQQSALGIGEVIEQSEGENHTIVRLLEDYCERLWQCSQETSGELRLEICEDLLDRWKKIKKRLKNEIPVQYEVVFLPYKASMWDSLESVWMAAREEENWNCFVMPIPYFDRKEDRSLGSLHYEGDQFPEYVPITHCQEYDLEKRHPDVIFIHNPYDECNLVTSVHPAYYSSELKRFTDFLVYIPYFICHKNIPEWHCVSPGVLYSDLVIVQSEEVRDTYIRAVSREMGWDEKKAREVGMYEKFLPLGSPKIDKAMSTRQENLVIPEEWREKIDWEPK